MAPQFVLQLSGLPGTGKSTLAGTLAVVTGAVHLDKDSLFTHFEAPLSHEATLGVYGHCSNGPTTS